MALCCVVVAAALTGCVERKLLIRTEPVGARVFVDGASYGLAPCEVPFESYGTREVTARAPGHRAARLVVHVDPPWWQYPVLDLITDVFVPWTITDHREVLIVMAASAPAGAGDAAALAERAAAARLAIDPRTGLDSAAPDSR